MTAKRKVQVIERYASNPALKTILPKWPGTPLDRRGRFVNHEFPWLPDFGDISKFMFQRNPQHDVKRHDKWNIQVMKNETWLNDPGDKIVWFGHATFFLQLSGTRIIIDPVFGALPVQKRHSELPVDPAKLKDIHYIIVSHAHYDHCDRDSLMLLAEHNPNANILTGLKMDQIIRKWIKAPIRTAGWYQQYQLNDGLEVTFMPSRHWSNRGLFDANSTLWGAFMIQKNGKCIYFGGDSGHGSHYNEIAKLFPKIDAALIGAGAYAPTWFMGPNHQDPFDAARAFNLTGAKTFIPFHYGTFDSADEPMGEPEAILTTLKNEGKINNELRILKLGEVFEV